MTAQFAEHLTLDNRELALCDTPLDLWLVASGKEDFFHSPASALRRGYMGKWRVIDNRLYLVGLSGQSTDNCQVRLQDLFPGFKKRVFAHWVSREMRCPQGRMLSYVHSEFASIFERDLFLRFKQGVLVGRREVVNGVSTDPKAPTHYGPGAWVRFGSNPNIRCPK